MSTNLEGVDFSEARPGGAALVAAGKAFVVRYIPYGGYTKGLTAAEITDYRAHGLAIVLVFEQTAERALQGRYAGVIDAKTSAAAIAALKMPADLPVYFAVDWDASPAQYAAIDAYLAGAASVLGATRVGVYGGYEVIRHCQTAGSARWFWQTYAWSRGLVAPGLHLHQYRNGVALGGGQVDLDVAMQPRYGQWEAAMDWTRVTPAGSVTTTAGGTLYRGDPDHPSGTVPSWTWAAAVPCYGTVTRADGKSMAVLRTTAFSASGDVCFYGMDHCSVPASSADAVTAAVNVALRPYLSFASTVAGAVAALNRGG